MACGSPLSINWNGLLVKVHFIHLFNQVLDLLHSLRLHTLTHQPYPRSTRTHARTLPTSHFPTRLSRSVLPPPPHPLKLTNLRRVFPEPHPQLSVIGVSTLPQTIKPIHISPKLLRLSPPSLVPSLSPSHSFSFRTTPPDLFHPPLLPT